VSSGDILGGSVVLVRLRSVDSVLDMLAALVLIAVKRCSVRRGTIGLACS